MLCTPLSYSKSIVHQSQQCEPSSLTADVIGGGPGETSLVFSVLEGYLQSYSMSCNIIPLSVLQQISLANFSHFFQFLPIFPIHIVISKIDNGNMQRFMLHPFSTILSFQETVIKLKCKIAQINGKIIIQVCTSNNLCIFQFITFKLPLNYSSFACTMLSFQLCSCLIT